MRKVIGQGSYGCVVSPPPSCKVPCTEDICREGVGKVMPEDAAIEESEKVAIINEMDPENRWHFPMAYSCEPVKHDIPADCNVAKREENLQTLFYKKAEGDLDHLLKTNPDPLLLESMDIIFEALVIINKNGYIHGDVKTQNILYLDYEKKIRKLYLTDFGLLGRINTYEPVANSEEYNYFVYPPEVGLWYTDRLSTGYIDSFINQKYPLPFNSYQILKARGFSDMYIKSSLRNTTRKDPDKYDVLDWDLYCIKFQWILILPLI